MVPKYWVHPYVKHILIDHDSLSEFKDRERLTFKLIESWERECWIVTCAWIIPEAIESKDYGRVHSCPCHYACVRLNFIEKVPRTI